MSVTRWWTMWRGTVCSTIEVAPVPGKLALLPGSRAMEVRTLLADHDSGGRSNSVAEDLADVVLIEAPGMGAVVDEVLAADGGGIGIRRVSGPDRRRELASCSLAWTASGTATLECALLDVPMVVGYRLQPLSYAIAQLLVRVPHVALVNLIAEERVAPELIQGEWRADRLAEVSRRLLDGGADRTAAGAWNGSGGGSVLPGPRGGRPRPFSSTVERSLRSRQRGSASSPQW